MKIKNIFFIFILVQFSLGNSNIEDFFLKSLPDGIKVFEVKNRFFCFDKEYLKSKLIDLDVWRCEEITEFVIPYKLSIDCKDLHLTIAFTINVPTKDSNQNIVTEKKHVLMYMKKTTGLLSKTLDQSFKCSYYKR